MMHCNNKSLKEWESTSFSVYSAIKNPFASIRKMILNVTDAKTLRNNRSYLQLLQTSLLNRPSIFLNNVFVC